jgi:hypothetical protein
MRFFSVAPAPEGTGSSELASWRGRQHDAPQGSGMLPAIRSTCAHRRPLVNLPDDATALAPRQRNSSRYSMVALTTLSHHMGGAAQRIEQRPISAPDALRSPRSALHLNCCAHQSACKAVEGIISAYPWYHPVSQPGVGHHRWPLSLKASTRAGRTVELFARSPRDHQTDTPPGLHPRRHPRESPKALPAPLSVSGRVRVAVEHETATGVHVGADTQALLHPSSTATTILRRECRVHQNHLLTGAHCLVRKGGAERYSARIRDRLSPMADPYQVGDPQVFEI